MAPASGTAALPSGGGTQKGAPKVKEPRATPRETGDPMDSRDGMNPWVLVGFHHGISWEANCFWEFLMRFHGITMVFFPQLDEWNIHIYGIYS